MNEILLAPTLSAPILQSVIYFTRGLNSCASSATRHAYTREVFGCATRRTGSGRVTSNMKSECILTQFCLVSLSSLSSIQQFSTINVDENLRPFFHNINFLSSSVHFLKRISALLQENLSTLNCDRNEQQHEFHVEECRSQWKCDRKCSHIFRFSCKSEITTMRKIHLFEFPLFSGISTNAQCSTSTVSLLLRLTQNIGVSKSILVSLEKVQLRTRVGMNQSVCMSTFLVLS